MYSEIFIFFFLKKIFILLENNLLLSFYFTILKSSRHKFNFKINDFKFKIFLKLKLKRIFLYLQ
jgi:hypothetical protein